LRTSESEGHDQIYDSSAAFDLKFLEWTRGDLGRNFKSAALVPHAFAVRSSRARRTRCHVHRSPLHERDDAFVPLVEAGWLQEIMILRNSEVKYFSRRDWTNAIFFGFA
jgi:hypothetical protein